jgi:hypothetical protein
LLKFSSARKRIIQRLNAVPATALECLLEKPLLQLVLGYQRPHLKVPRVGQWRRASQWHRCPAAAATGGLASLFVHRENWRRSRPSRPRGAHATTTPPL